jgi:hypothetical protein
MMAPPEGSAVRRSSHEEHRVRDDPHGGSFPVLSRT